VGTPLIINARDRLGWQQRLVSDASTAVMWGGWLWLWAPVVRAWAALGMRAHPSLVKLIGAGPVDSLERMAFALAGTSGALLVWNRLAARKARATVALSLRDYAERFELPEAELRAGREASVCIVRHDDSGRIVQLECRGADVYPAPVATSS
jgi:poly-beta-1,6-N-acetyl-D-glucosamine biosynthesis protein PgaD